MFISERTYNSECQLIPVILSGGKGTRLWPLSRECYPKQYLKLDDNSNFSLLQNTYMRLVGIKNLGEPIIICNEEQRFIVAEQMRELKVNPLSITLEPIGRNTAPAIALAALQATKDKKDPNLLILSADHKIQNEKLFRDTVNNAIPYSNRGRIINFGVLPDAPETGFGYIESYEEISNNNQSSRIKRFVEKPNEEVAKRFIKNKSFTWNSGIFLCKASIILEELKKFEPSIIEHCENSLAQAKIDLDFLRVEKTNFSKCKNIAIDIAVMEKTKLGTVFSLDAGWSDIGNWKSLWENSNKDEKGNTIKGKVITKDTKNCFIRGEKRLIVCLGLEDVILIETDDSVLVSKKDFTQRVKEIVHELKDKNYPEFQYNKKICRPWGSFTSIIDDIGWQVKKLYIKPGASLSLQKHNFRSEHWVVVDGIAKVQIDDNIFTLRKNESTYIPLGSKHRLSNPHKTPLVLIEVQSGSYLGEDDIIRFDDKYGR